MTALLLSTAGGTLGGAIAGPLGAMAGRLAGALAGSVIDQRLFGSRGASRTVEGPRLKDLDVQASTEGSSIPQVFGRARVTGEIIWATRFEEVATTEVQRSGGGKGRLGGGGAGGATTTTTTYAYYANVAIGLCEGPIAHIGRIWADGKPLDLNGLIWRLHPGAETQAPDPLIQAKQGGSPVPAYRGLAYVVFERLPLAPFGNRLPQLSFEVIRPIGTLEKKIKGVCLIPGATEFGYQVDPVARDAGFGRTSWENRATGAGTDIVASLDELQRLCPVLEHVALVVVWYGTDLRCGQCQILPGVDIAAKNTTGDLWLVSGVDRANAYLVSQIDGRAAWGGTPSDASIHAAITHLKARGLKVTLLPMLFMDIPKGNGKEDPWTGAAEQPVHPWRGRVTCDPAPGRPGTPDGTPAVLAQVEAFFGNAVPTDFSVATVPGAARPVVTYSGSGAGYRRMILHYAHLAAAAGGVDGFVIGSELVWMTRLRDTRQSFPVVTRLAQLASEVAALLLGASLTYAADWTEYGAYQPSDGSGDLVFPLDRLWAHPAIDRVGIDFYPPLTDWRDGDGHADAGIARSGADGSYIATRITGGEAFDWYYADGEARAAQLRVPITDGAYGKPWVYRPKDLVGWWSSSHIERLDGIEVGATDWVPGLKPIRLVEVGIPAVDKGANQPNIFPDPRSSEGGLPYASTGARDDAVQRRAIESILNHFDPNGPNATLLNPASPLDGRRMVDHDAINLWCWDARPWPAFPGRADLWSDGPNWRTGHWLNGRLGSAPVDALIATLVERFGGPPVDMSEADGVATGYVVDRPMSGRAAIEPIALAFGLDLVERQGVLTARARGRKPLVTIDADDLAFDEGSDRARIVRAQESELPRAVTFTFADPDREFRRAAVTARRAVGGYERESRSDLALVQPADLIEADAELVLRRLWAARETAAFALPPSALALEPGDVVDLVVEGRHRHLRLVKVTEGLARRIEAEGEDVALSRPAPSLPRVPTVSSPVSPGRPFALLLDLPRLPGDDAPHRPRLAATADPWPGALTLWRAAEGGFEPAAVVERASILGTLLDPLPAGSIWRFQRGASARVELAGGTLVSVSEEALLDGANAAALRHPDGQWEIVQFAGATLEAPRTYRLATFLRGQLGTEALAANTLPPGALFVLLDGAPVGFPIARDDIGRESAWRLVPAGLPHEDSTGLALHLLPSGRGLVPLSPVRARAIRRAAGIEISFIRRSRVDADSWELAEVPLGEEAEAYTVEILDGGMVKRALNTNAPKILYPTAQELADFAAPLQAITLRIRQVSTLVGPGAPFLATLSADIEP